MKFNDIQKIDLPEEFPDKEFEYFMQSCKSVLLPNKDDSWKEFAGASNLIGWRFRACYEYMRNYVDSWRKYGANVSFEELYLRERALFGMFACGVSCIDSTCYAIYALISHNSILGIHFGEKEQRRCNPKNLKRALEPHRKANYLVDLLDSIIQSEEWELWIELRNRMTHRSNLPRIIKGAMGSIPPPAKAFEFASTSSTPFIEADEARLESLFRWLAQSLSKLLTVGGDIVENQLSSSTFKLGGLMNIDFIKNVTYSLLEECKLPYKKCNQILIDDALKKGALWMGLSDTEGKIFISPFVSISDFGCIAHEIGHGAFEASRVEDKNGEDFAEAIRYFVEEKHIKSKWFHNAKSSIKDSFILVECNWNFNSFKEMCLSDKFSFLKPVSKRL